MVSLSRPRKSSLNSSTQRWRRSIKRTDTFSMREKRQILSFLFVGRLEQILTELSIDPSQEPECLSVSTMRHRLGEHHRSSEGSLRKWQMTRRLKWPSLQKMLLLEKPSCSLSCWHSPCFCPPPPPTTRGDTSLSLNNFVFFFLNLF